MEGNLQAAEAEIEKALRLMETAAPALVREEVVAQQVSVFLAVDRLGEAQAALKSYGFSFDEEFVHPPLEVSAQILHPEGLLFNSALRIVLYRSRTLGKEQDLHQAILLAEQIIDGSLRAQSLPIALQTLLLRAQLYVVSGNERAGLADVLTALKLAEPQGVISIFVEEGTPIAESLSTLLRRKLLGAVKMMFAKDILSAFPNVKALDKASGELAAAKLVTSDVEDLAPIDPLTPRELEVLTHIAAGDSNQVIAEKLVITVSAVKKHTRNIYAKLNVNSRTQAVARARQLGLINADG
jgi:LuxR family maltose regulon positive regulatory protein